MVWAESQVNAALCSLVPFQTLLVRLHPLVEDVDRAIKRMQVIQVLEDSDRGLNKASGRVHYG